jgi:hypothetical protein
MSDFIPTVTITLAEYDKLRRDAAPVQNRVRMTHSCLIDAYNEYERACGMQPIGAINARKRLGNYLRYVQRCVLRACDPVPFGDWETWTKPGDPS